MTRRTPPLEGQGRNKRNSLLTALHAPGKNTEMVRLRTVSLLVFKPTGYDRDEWLRAILPKDWEADKAIASLNGHGDTDNGVENGQPTEPSSNTGKASDRPRHGRPRRAARR